MIILSSQSRSPYLYVGLSLDLSTVDKNICCFMDVGPSLYCNFNALQLFLNTPIIVTSSHWLNGIIVLRERVKNSNCTKYR